MKDNLLKEYLPVMQLLDIIFLMPQQLLWDLEYPIGKSCMQPYLNLGHLGKAIC